MATKFRFICLSPDLLSRARVRPPADKHSFLTIKTDEDPPASGCAKTRVPASKPFRF